MTSPPREEKENRKLEITYSVLANTVVNQLIEAGCRPGQLIDFGSEVLRCVTEKGFTPGVNSQILSAENSQLHTILYDRQPDDHNRHTIIGSRTRLIPLREKDAVFLETWLTDPEIHKTHSYRLLRYLLEHIDSIHALDTRRDFIVRDENGTEIGLVCLFQIEEEPRQAEMAKLLGNPQARGKGYAKEATQLLLGYGFDELKLQRVYLRTAGFNLHNIRLNEKLGFKFEGILREACILEDNLIDEVIMSMLSREFFAHFKLEKKQG